MIPKPHRAVRDLLFAAMLLASYLGSTAGAQLLQPDPQLDWRSAQSQHFTVHYPEDAESLAVRLASIAEETHGSFYDQLKHEPNGRVEIFVQDSYDIVNSLASVPLHRSVYIFPDPPYGIPYGQIGHYQEWLRLAFVHEYAHILDLEKKENLWELIHTVTGFGYANIFRPLWTIEGFAVWAEAHFAGGGRVGSPTMEMILRSDVLAGRFRKPDQWSGAADPWPGVGMPYWYGAAFMRYLSDTYRPEAPVRFRDETAGALPWGYARQLYFLTKRKPFPAVLAEFFESLKERADSTIAWVERQNPVSEGDLVIRPGTTILDVAASSDNKHIYVAHDADQAPQAIARFETASGYARRITVTAGQDVKIAEDPATGRIVYSDSDITGSSRLLSSLYAVAAEGGGKRKVSRVGRLHEPAVSPVDGSVIACQRHRGRSRLVRVMTDEVEPFRTTIPGDADVFHPGWSRDGSNLTVSVWRPPGHQDIWLVDAATGAAEALTDDEHWDVAPVFSPDGRLVLFSSDRTGVWNIYALELASRRLMQVTNVTTGAFLPEVSPDQQCLYYVRYSPDGDEIRRLPYRPDLWRAVHPDSQPRLQNYEEYLTRVSPRAQDPAPGERASQWEFHEPSVHPRSAGHQQWYHDLRFLRPILRLPLPLADEEGLVGSVLVLGSDPLARDSYMGWVGYGFSSFRLSYSGTFQSYRLPRVRTELAAHDAAVPTDIEIPSSDESSKEFLWRRDQSYTIAVACPWLETTKALEARIGVTLKRTRALAPEVGGGAESVVPDFRVGRTTELHLGLAFSSAQEYPISFSPENGARTAATLRLLTKAFGGGETGAGGEIDLRGYRRIADDLVAAARAVGMRATKGDISLGPAGNAGAVGLDSTYTASSLLMGAADLRFRVKEIQRKLLWDWLFMNRVHGALFSELAHYRDYDWSVQKTASWGRVTSVGARLSLDVTLGFVFKWTADLIVADPSPGKPFVRVGLSSAF